MSLLVIDDQQYCIYQKQSITKFKNFQRTYIYISPLAGPLKTIICRKCMYDNDFRESVIRYCKNIVHNTVLAFTSISII